MKLGTGIIAILLLSVVLNFQGINESKSFHNPIYIEGDANFTYANGVLGGSGTESDPYVIANWEIECTDSHGIWIANTSLHFVIRNVLIRSQTPSSFHGIYFTNVSNGRIENVSIENAAYGLGIFEGKNIFISYAIATNCSFGFNFFGVEDLEVVNTNFKNNANGGIAIEAKNIRLRGVEGGGVSLIGVSNSEISSCCFEAEDFALRAEECTALNIFNNAFSGSILLLGEDLSAYNTHTISANKVNGKDVLYVKNSTGLALSGDYGEIILASVSDTTISNLEMSNASLLIEIAYSQRLSITAANLSLAKCAIYTIGSSQLEVKDCKISNAENGILILSSQGFSIENTKFEGTESSIAVQSSSYVNISKCNFTNSITGVAASDAAALLLSRLNFTGNTNAISLQRTANTQIKDCIFVKNELGVRMSFANENTIARNLFIASTYYAILLDSSTSDNTIYENAFLLNHQGSVQAYDEGNNKWYNASRGNFWDDMDLIDANNDGIVDTAYQIDGSASDLFPLVNTPLALPLSVECSISSQEIYIHESLTFTLHVFWYDIGIPNAHVEFSAELGEISANNCTDEGGVIYGIYNANKSGIENITFAIKRPGFLQKTASIQIKILDYPKLEIVLSHPSLAYALESISVEIFVHSQGQGIEGAMISISISPDALISEKTLLSGQNGSAKVLITFPQVEEEINFSLYVNASKTGYKDCFAISNITVLPLESLDVNFSCPKKLASNTTTELTITITSKNQFVSDVNISLSAEHCTFAQSTGLTGANGSFTTSMRVAYVEHETLLKIYLHAWKRGYKEVHLEFEVYIGNPPKEPILRGSAVAGKVILRWEAVSEAEIYYVYRAETPGDYKLIGTTTTEGFEDKNVANGHTYYYKVRARNDYGFSEWSNEIALTPVEISKTPGFELFLLIAIYLFFMALKPKN